MCMMTTDQQIAPISRKAAPITVPGAADNESCAPLLAKATREPKAGAPAAVASDAAPAARRQAPAQLPAAGEFSGGDPRR